MIEITKDDRCATAVIRELKQPISKEWVEEAEYLRELARRVEAGDISEYVVVLNDRTDGSYQRRAVFHDRWRLLGALEYAKQAAASD